MARRIRWASPPDRVPLARDRVRYSRPTLPEKAQPLFDFFQNPLGDHGFPVGEGQSFQKFQGLCHGKVGEIGDVDAAHRHRQSLGFEPFAVAGLAGDGAHALFDLFPHTFAGAFPVPPFQVAAAPLRKPGYSEPLPPERFQCSSSFFAFGAVENGVQQPFWADLSPGYPGKSRISGPGPSKYIRAMLPSVQGVPAGGLDGPFVGWTGSGWG